MKMTKSLFGLALAGLMLGGVAEARDLRVAPAGPPAHPAHYMYEHFAERLSAASGGKMTATILGPEVVALPQMKDALQSGLIDIGNYLPLYFAAGMENTNVAGAFALVGRNPMVMTLAMTDFVVNCAPCQKEFTDQGLVFLGSGSSDAYVLLTTKPVRTAEDLKGLRLRSGGAPYSRWAEHFGATPVNMGVGDTFEGMSQGTIDGTMASVVDLLSFRLIDVAKYVTRVPIGTYHDTSNFTVAQASWTSLSDEEKAQLVDANTRGNFDLTDRWAYQLPAAANMAVADSSIEVIENPDLVAASEAFAAEDETAQIAAGGELAAQFAALVDKWSAVVAKTGEDPDALAAIAKTEIWDKVDWAHYGMPM
ncbi:MAG: C4-dicarboxylate TRAP transporter substrate-binding protein [bacterium]